MEVPGDGGSITPVMGEQVNPAGVEADAVSATVPVKPFTAVTVIVEVPVAPARICDGVTAPAATVKSTTWKRMLAVVRDRVPLAPVTVTV